MPFRGVADPETLARLHEVLTDFCAQRGIDSASDDWMRAAEQLMALFSAGVSDPEDLMHRLTSAHRTNRNQAP